MMGGEEVGRDKDRTGRARQDRTRQDRTYLRGSSTGEGRETWRASQVLLALAVAGRRRLRD